MKRLIVRVKMLWYVFTKKQVIVLTESHKHGTHQWNCKELWDTRSIWDTRKIIDTFLRKLI